MRKLITILFLFVSGLIHAQVYTPNGIVTSTGDPSTGNVGIGIPNPSAKLEIQSNVGNSGLRIQGGLPYGTYYLDIASFLQQSPWSVGYSFNVKTSSGNYNNVMTLIDGKVGIGTISPNQKMDVRGGTMQVVNYTNAGYTFIGRNADPGNNDSYFYHLISPSYHILGSNKNGSGLQRKLGFAMGGGDTESDIKMTIDNTGNVGVGTTNPWEKLHVNGTLGIGTFTNDPHSGLQIQYTDDGSGTTVFKHQRWGGNFYFKRNDATGEKTQLFFGGAGNHYMDIYNNNNEVKVRLMSGGDSYLMGGNLGIGTDAPDAKLAVKGDIHTKEVRVDVSGSMVGDYVFEKDYNLISLPQLETYLKQNKHLPEVPSAKEFEAEGMKLKEMNLMLLKKVEELTLYLIEQNQNAKKQQAELDKVKSEIEILKNK